MNRHSSTLSENFERHGTARRSEKKQAITVIRRPFVLWNDGKSDGILRDSLDANDRGHVEANTKDRRICST